MGMLSALKLRVVDEIGRPGLLRQAGDYIERAIAHYASERFWFNIRSGTTTTTAGNAYATLPAGLQREDGAFVTQGGLLVPLERRAFSEFEDLNAGSASTGQPSDYAICDGQARLYPTPAAAYTLTFPGIYAETAFANDAASNAWSTEAADLIAARAKMLIYRNVLRDVEGAQIEAQAEAEALAQLRAETVQRLGSGTLKTG